MDRKKKVGQADRQTDRKDRYPCQLEGGPKGEFSIFYEIVTL